MSDVVVTVFSVPERRAEVIAAFEAAITRVHGEPGVELCALQEGRDRLVMIEKYESEQARSATPRARPSPACGPPWRASSALGGQVQQRSRAQVLVPRPAGNAQKGAL